MDDIIGRLKHEFSKGTVLIKIIYLNVGVFVLSQVIDALLHLLGNNYSISNELFSLPADIELLFQPWTILTYSVFHSGLGHIFFNMVILYLGGQIFLQYLSQKQFLSVYVLGVIVGGIFFVLGINLFPVFDNPIASYSLIGASAGVMAVLISIATYVPNYSLKLFLVGNVKLWQLALFFLFLDFLNINNGNEGGHLSHLGGAFIGYIYSKQLQKHTDIGLWVGNLLDKISSLFSKNRSPFQKVYKNKVPRNDYNFNMSKRDKEAQVDGILDKISKSGYDSLSSEEKDFLFKAGK
ncbi:MAG: rhomboid family intramembrane serine protease [Ichthyobacteriaceae bacterium]|nr:rhomboid family intramembrane serine protease [Ichthyobacteriaceae bacterium]